MLFVVVEINLKNIEVVRGCVQKTGNLFPLQIQTVSNHYTMKFISEILFSPSTSKQILRSIVK